MMDVLDRLKNLERSTGERFPGAVVIVSRHTVVDAVVEIERLKDLIEAKHQLYNIVCEEAERLRDIPFTCKKWS